MQLLRSRKNFFASTTGHGSVGIQLRLRILPNERERENLFAGKKLWTS